MAAPVESSVRRVEARLGVGGLAGRMAHHAVPGMGVAVIADGELVFEASYGVRETGLPDPVRATTRFQACSISKPVAVLGMLRLVERGVVDLDADVNDVLTSWRVPPSAQWQPRVTLRQLASHSAGVTVSGFPGYRGGAPVPTLAQVLTGTDPANTPAIRVDTLPGLQFRYAGGGTTVLQQVIEDVTGHPFARVVRELVLDPLGMTRSVYAQPLPPELHAEAATAHRSDGTPLPGRWHVYPELAAAGLWTTPGDLARFAVAVRDAYLGRPGAILRTDLAREMLTPQIASTGRLGGLAWLGLGLFLGGRPPGSTFGHGGSNEGFKCHLLAHRDAGWGAVAMTNGERGELLVQEVLDELGRELDWRGYEPGEPPPAYLVSGPSLDTFVGVYELRPGTTVEVSRRVDALGVRITGQDEVRFLQISDTEFGSFAADTTLRFGPSEDGRTAELIVCQNGDELSCRRVGASPASG